MWHGTIIKITITILFCLISLNGYGQQISLSLEDWRALVTEYRKSVSLQKNLTREIENLQGELKKAKESLKDSEEKIQNLETELTNSKTLQRTSEDKIKQLEKQLAEAKKQPEEYQKQITSLQTHISELDKLLTSTQSDANEGISLQEPIIEELEKKVFIWKGITIALGALLTLEIFRALLFSN